ncbi:MAG: response regulator [Mucilaginibacter sp.]|jgi:CheY-like chemotaxis protein
MKKLIFIDDSPLDQFILKRILSRYKLTYEVKCTDDGEEVIAFLEENKDNSDILPDIILLDLYMPYFDGWKFLDNVDKIYEDLTRTLKIYVLSSSINPSDIKQATRYSFVRSFIFKPITKEMLEKLVDEQVSENG